VRHVAFARLHNLRDVGGYAAADGRAVAYRRLYRSDSLGKLGPEDDAAFRALGVRTVIDLRYDWEIAAAGRVPAAYGLEYHNLCIEHRPYDQAALGPEVDATGYLAERYLEVAEDGVAELRAALEVVADRPGPVVVHCTSGKDRTGLVVAVVLGLLGVGEGHVVADFALTGLATERLRADWQAANPGRVPWAAYGEAPPELMRLFLRGLDERYGSLRGYAYDAVGVTDDLVARLRDRLLEKG
jgi:protein-tyrosine phosphatase